MSGHTLAASTYTVEMLQVIEINSQLASLDLGQGQVSPARGGSGMVTAEFLGLTGAQVRPRTVDRVAAALLRQERQKRQNETLILPGSASLRSILAAGDPSYPYLYGVFGESGGGRRRLPAIVHTEHLRLISSVLDLRRHRWGL